MFESSRRMVEDATVVRRSLERGLDPSRRATSRHLVPLRAGISNRQPIPGPALLVYCRVVFVENCHSLTNSFVYDFERFFFCSVRKF